ncbi:hypothetical protein [Nocardia neocaledoniensis]|uniref:hypothetical protein n=1 Tax=Nocardia neocaledoniensis TaxID=236511 RepID=UPI000D70C41D|nr:hypothetical protein [Nocardia neocaledoniensis]
MFDDIGGSMSTVDDRLVLAAGWLHNNAVRMDDEHVGWGWSSDVTPNPQDTAEAVCAMTAARSHATGEHLLRTPEVPEVPKVSALLRLRSVTHATQGEWAFQSPVDAAWRLRALKDLSPAGTEPDLSTYRHALLSTQDPNTGGWTMSDSAASISVTATTAAIRALLEFPPSDTEADAAVRRGCDFLVNAVRAEDPRAMTNYATAKIAYLLGTGRLAELGNPRIDRAHAHAIDRVLHYVETAPGTLEEEPIRRGNVTQTWYHATLPQSILALATSRKQLIFHPAFRAGFTELLDYQQLSLTHRDYGGFKTSRGGLITSYATAQSVHALIQVNADVRERVNPGTVFDLLCNASSSHHTDPQNIAPSKLPPVRMNSTAGAAALAVGAATGLTIIFLALMFDEGTLEPLGKPASRALIYWGTAFISIGLYCWAATRFHRFARSRLMSLVAAVFTAGVFPFLAFLLT